MSDYYHKLHNLLQDHVLFKNLWFIVTSYCEYDSFSADDFLKSEKGNGFGQAFLCAKYCDDLIEIDSEHKTRKNRLEGGTDIKMVFDVWCMGYTGIRCVLFAHSKEMFGLYIFTEPADMFDWASTTLYVARSIELLFSHSETKKYIKGSRIKILDR